ncbi:flagellar biosynthesis anti-sigma factor FlgM [Defluviitalea phaphyphila]|uniref:flagellar biosynthesis anti-sigma factor FlgM n=1 Tax=Defluviitalea phaphyphila TaxID=1473580 RepID=UPI00072FA8FC|nr:flagellar biosynthesis anti-sigma factor FlgM [Defluviitalea phaphyphila]
MKITRVNQILKIYNKNNTIRSEKINKSNGRDEFNISQQGKDFQTALEALSKVPDIREDKVNDIKRRIKSGTYNISAEEVANKIVERAFDKKI